MSDLKTPAKPLTDHPVKLQIFSPFGACNPPIGYGTYDPQRNQITCEFDTRSIALGGVITVFTQEELGLGAIKMRVIVKATDCTIGVEVLETNVSQRPPFM